MNAIDVHGHLVPQTFPPCPDNVPPHEWPVMEPLDDGRARMMIDGKEFRIFDPVYWDVPGRVAHLDSEGITVQILSPLPELLGYWLDPLTTMALAEHLHATIAEAIAQAPTRLAGLGMLPMQDVDRAVAMSADIKRLGLCGVLLASNVDGVSLADARFDPVWAELERLGLAVLVHGYRPAGMERLIGSPLMAPVIGVPQDCGAVVASFIMTDILGRFPALRLGFVQGGGTFGAVLDRMDHVWRNFPQMRAKLSTSPRDYVRRFGFDSVTFSTDYLRYLLKAYGPDSMMAGTDGPTPIGQTGLAAHILEACDGDAELVEKVLWRNAVRFFALHDLVINPLCAEFPPQPD